MKLKSKIQDHCMICHPYLETINKQKNSKTHETSFSLHFLPLSFHLALSFFYVNCPIALAPIGQEPINI